MTRRFLRASFLALTFELILLQVSSAQELTSVKIAFDRETCLYSAGDVATITVSALDASNAPVTSGKLTVRVTNDGRDLLKEEERELAQLSEPLVLTQTLDKPGFIKVMATAVSADGSTAKQALAGAGFDPLEIQPGLPKPDDFDEFWARGKEEVRAIPLDLKQTKIESLSNENRDMYAISFATVDNQRLYGYLGVPKKGEAPYPAIVNVAWAGLGFGPDPGAADEGFAILTLNVFPYECPIDQAERQRLYDEYNKNLGVLYFYLNSDDRDKFFYRAPYLGLDRIVDWFVEQDYVDKTRVGYHGTSQGGGFGLVLGGLNKSFTDMVVSVPALCDQGGCLTGRCSGWPQLIDNANGDEKVREASRYYDAANFARSINVPITVTVGFVDVTCVPSSVYAAFNVIPSAKKQIVHNVNSGHAPDLSYGGALAALKERLKNRQ